MFNGRNVKFQLSDKPVNEGCVRPIRSVPWEDSNVLEERNKQKAADSEPIKLQGFGFSQFCRDESFLVDSEHTGRRYRPVIYPLI
jgi:RNA-dependent RNA polymerase